ncbi:MAG TPA: hypothetical protein VIU45_00615 [Chitinophagaceae bacterium]
MKHATSDYLHSFNHTMTPRIHYTLRVASAMCFIGHGAWGIIRQPAWYNYFAVAGIGHDLAYSLMPALGTFDILLGIILLFYPLRAIPAWLVVWGFVTALLRPLSGEPLAEFIERAGNFGAPLALLVFSGGMGKNLRDLVCPIEPDIYPDAKTLIQVKTCLRIIVALLLAGHGWLNVIGKKGLLDQYAALGFQNPYEVAHAIGIFEILAGFTVLIRPMRPLLLVFVIWKMGSELFYPHYELFQWLERGGSYGCLLALWFITGKTALPGKKKEPAYYSITAPA